MAFLLTTGAALAHAADASMPWAFVNGSAKGYSIKLESVSPAPGSRIRVGETVKFEVRVSYKLTVADAGKVILVIQDESNKNLIAGQQQTNQSVTRGKGSVTLTQDFVVPTGSQEVVLFIPLVPNGMSHTSGELVVRYPIADYNASSSIGDASVAPDPVAQAAGTPTVESVRQFLATVSFDGILAELRERMKAYVRTQLEQNAASEKYNARQRALFNEFEAKSLLAIDDELTWPRVESVLVGAHQDTFSQQDIDALIAFYRSDSGRAVIAAIPQALQEFTPDRVAKWGTILEQQGSEAAMKRIKEEVGVVFKPAEVEGFCAFFASETGKDITARAPDLKKHLAERFGRLQEDVGARFEELAKRYEVRIQAAGEQ
jgi:hypothetical protein